jgi:beta-phosphoglucomutase-like phosphatase (HAD superfamily)
VKAIDAVLFNPVGVVVDDRGEPYPDAAPALAELDALGVKVIEVVSITAAALAGAVAAASLSPDRVICLTDTEEGIRAAKDAGIAPILMMNDPDEAMRLTAFEPAGGVVSLVELPDFVRLLLARGVTREP